MRVELTGAAYAARSTIASAQRCVNLYPESVPGAQGEPVRMAHLPTPGLTQLAASLDGGPVRCLWFANNGTLFAVINETLYYVTPNWSLNALGTIPGSGPVSMSDNGVWLVIVNGTASGWKVDLLNNAFTAIVDAAFYGADRVDYIDTYFIFNKPNTPQWYVGSSDVTFNPLYFANKTGSGDNIATVAAAKREVWLIGNVTAEVFFDSGAADFPFAVVPGAFIEQGTCAVHSVAKSGNGLMWLSQNRIGARYVLRAENYQAQRVSTFAIEDAIAGYATVSDAIGFSYQQGGHGFYVLIFPSEDVTWVLDEAEGLWHQRAWSDTDGNLHRWRANCGTLAYGKIIVGDWQNGKIYAVDEDSYTDNGAAIQRIRSWPHMVEDGDRVIYRQFIADMEVGAASDPTLTPEVSLRWSDTRGKSWGNPVVLSIGAQGDYYLSVQAQRLGMARDRVFEISWSAPVRTSLTGAFIESIKAAT